MDEVPSRAVHVSFCPIRALSIHATLWMPSFRSVLQGWMAHSGRTRHRRRRDSLVATGRTDAATTDAFERADGVTVTATAEDGACVFLEAGSGMTPPLCAIHRLRARQ